MSQQDELCLFLEWDSAFFNRRIARLNDSRLAQKTLPAVLSWCKQNAIECLYFLADSDDPQTVWLAQQNGFLLVEVRYTLERSLTDWDPSSRPRSAETILTRTAGAADLLEVQSIASTSYIDSRYYFDPHFSEEMWAAYYRAWVKRSIEGGADLALIAEKAGEVVGYITGLIDPTTHQGIYELTGVRESERRSGVGQELFRSGLDWYVRNAIDYLRVSTQGRNIATQRMIQRHGFLSKSCQLFYHRWFNDQV